MTFLLLLALTFSVSAQGFYFAPISAQKERSAHSKKKTKFHYVCPMHEDVTSKRRGVCPKCKMKLERKPIVKEPSEQTEPGE